MPLPILNPWAFPVGAGLALLLPFGLIYWQRRRRRIRGERPPIETNLLRPPGHSLSIRLQEKEESSSTAIAAMAFCGGMLSLGSAMFGSFLFGGAVEQFRHQHGAWLTL